MNGRCRAYRATLTIAVPLLLGGCTYERAGPAKLHYEEFKTVAPEGNRVTVCHAYGCQKKTDFTFTEADIGHIAALMGDVRREDTPHEERRAMAHAVAWIEHRVGAEIGTSSDRASIDVFGSNDATQQDCVDEATNTTSYLTVMARNGLLRHHTVERPFAKGNLILGIWPHWTAVIADRTTGQRYAVDSSNSANGGNPEVLTAESWYIDEGGPSPRAQPRPPVATADSRGASGLQRMVEDVLADRDPAALTTGSLR